MTEVETQERPHKKRRFFVEDSPPHDATFAAEPASSPPDDTAAAPKTGADVFDADTFRAIAGGEVPPSTMRSLQGRFGGNLEQAINAYFDGSWKTPSPQKPPPSQPLPGTQRTAPAPVFRKYSSKEGKTSYTTLSSSPAAPVPAPPPRLPSLDSMPSTRYIGALGVAGWTTRSGINLLRPEDVVKIERTKQILPQKPGRGGKAKQILRKTQDVIVRFTNTKGEEIGRLEKDSANWISTLIDQKVCSFEGNCVFAPERIRTNDTVYLQLRCFLLTAAFEKGNFIKPLENNRETGIFEAKETTDERDLRLRQIGLVKLFSEINLHPSKVNETTARHKREGILQAAEVAEQYEHQDKKPKDGTPGDGGVGSSPPSEDAAEEGEELEQDQLDTLYKKAQTFDFNTPEAQPASTFTMDLR
ncbi:DNA helicase rad5, partial [Teratosphaeriaceae sp. CCFEE 6253]